ncbi:MAG: tRNA dihydrouridine synthase DusB [Nanoarchaeota archaeon]|nr:tRNA dihydrouridine synthase DusB [Nanoarchaeota archaeon]
MSSTFPKLTSKALLSPMAGVTDVAFRTLAKRYGAGLTYTEFVSSTALVRGSKKTLHMLQTDPSEKPVAVQLFGNNVQDVITAAQQLEDKFDIFDINCGCPAWKVIKTGAGSALLNNPEKIAAFINKLASAINKPVTLKIRTGIHKENINAIAIAQAAEQAGAAAIAIHGRTQQQGYSGTADWEVIKKVKAAVNIPVIGNGDVFTPEHCKQRLEESGVDYIMIARGAIGNPYIFTQINDYLTKGSYQQPDNIKDLTTYITLAEHYNLPLATIKNQTITFTKGMTGGAKLRTTLSTAKTIEDIKNILTTLQKHTNL